LSSDINLRSKITNAEFQVAASPVARDDGSRIAAWQQHAPAGFHFRHPCVEDGARVHALIAACPPLDTNSLYCNLLQCSHFAEWALLAEVSGAPQDALPAGFISAYRVRPDTLFVWQVAVADAARGKGLASAMLAALTAREAQRPEGLRTIETTITPDNAASWGLFRRLATRLAAGTEELPCFDRHQHFAGSHESELLLRIGPVSDPLRRFL